MSTSATGRTPTRRELASAITKRLEQEQARLTLDFRPRGGMQFCYVDDLLGEPAAQQIYSAFPTKEQMVLKKNLGQKKYVAVQMDKYSPLLEEIIYAFQEPEVVRLVERITGMQGLLPDSNLYAGGLSLMDRGNFLNPPSGQFA